MSVMCMDCGRNEGFGPRTLCRICSRENDDLAVGNTAQEQIPGYAALLTKAAALETELAKITAERDALLAGKWARVEWQTDQYGGLLLNGVNGWMATVSPARDNNPTYWWLRGGSMVRAASVAEAQAAVLDALRGAGWFLAEVTPDQKKGGC